MIVLESGPKQQLKPFNTREALITVSRGRSLDYSPVYDLYIFKNGKVVYNGLDNVKVKGFVETEISIDCLNQIENLINTANANDIKKPKGRTFALTLLKYQKKKVLYQPLRINGNILKINNLIEDIRKSL